MGYADHHSVLVADGEDEGKFVGREDGRTDSVGGKDDDGSLDGNLDGDSVGRKDNDGVDDGNDAHKSPKRSVDSDDPKLPLPSLIMESS